MRTTIDGAAIDRYITGNWGEDAVSEEPDPTDVLFGQWPAPWAYSDTHEGHEGLVTVFAANGTDILCTGDMESCGMAEIRLAEAIAALPALLELAQFVAADYDDAADWKDARSHLLRLAQGALGHFET
jgi:hypothetical protein